MKIFFIKKLYSTKKLKKQGKTYEPKTTIKYMTKKSFINATNMYNHQIKVLKIYEFFY